MDEIIIGIEKKSKVGKLFFGSNAQYIILESPCPVVSVKIEKPEVFPLFDVSCIFVIQRPVSVSAGTPAFFTHLSGSISFF